MTNQHSRGHQGARTGDLVYSTVNPIKTSTRGSRPGPLGEVKRLTSIVGGPFYF
jgi:hypothetical protein